jgi:hypothetical protein
VIYRGEESENSSASTTRALDTDTDFPPQKGSSDLHLSSLGSKEVHQLRTPGSSAHRLRLPDSPGTESFANPNVKRIGSDNATKLPLLPLSSLVRPPENFCNCSHLDTLEYCYSRCWAHMAFPNRSHDLQVIMVWSFGDAAALNEQFGL